MDGHRRPLFAVGPLGPLLGRRRPVVHLRAIMVGPFHHAGAMPPRVVAMPPAVVVLVLDQWRPVRKVPFGLLALLLLLRLLGVPKTQ